jgi:hypothetical protein
VNDAPPRSLRPLLLALLLTAIGVGVLYLLQREPEPPVETAVTAPTATVIIPDATTFAAWVQHEDLPESARQAWTAYYLDAILGHQVFRVPPGGVHPQIARSLLLDDDGLLFSRGPRLWNRELTYQPVMVGTFCYIH